MREAVASVTAPAVRPSLEAVRNRFKTWRKKGRARRRISEPLWGAAVELCRDHSVSQVSRALRLDYYGLRNRREGGRRGDILYSPLSREKFSS